MLMVVEESGLDEGMEHAAGLMSHGRNTEMSSLELEGFDLHIEGKRTPHCHEVMAGIPGSLFQQTLSRTKMAAKMSCMISSTITCQDSQNVL